MGMFLWQIMGYVPIIDHRYIPMVDHGYVPMAQQDAESIFGQNVEDAIWNAMSEALHKTEFDL